MWRITLLFVLSLTSCKQERPFDGVLWNSNDGVFWTYRESMLYDLTKNHKLVGLKYSEAIRLLGGSNYHESDGSLSYNIITEYGSDIDPVYTKTLELNFNKDSILTSFKVKEWHKR